MTRFFQFKTLAVAALVLLLTSAVLTATLWLGTPSAVAQSTCGETETVQPGDTLQAIALRCSTTVAAILLFNPSITNPDLIQVGQVLTIAEPEDDTSITPAATATLLPTPTAASVEAEIYVVQPGDRLVDIAVTYDTTVAAIVAANPAVSNADQIIVGQQLLIPAESADVPDAPTAPDAAVTELLATVTVTPTMTPTADVTPTVAVSTAVTPTPTLTTAQNMTQTSAAPPSAPGPAAPQPDATGIDNAEVYVIALNPESEIAESTAGDTAGDTIGCGDTLVPIDVTVDPTLPLINAALTALLDLDAQTVGELYDALAQSDLALGSVEIDGDTARVALTGELLLGGVCDVPRVRGQIEATARQFATVENVEITVNDVPWEFVSQ